MKKKILLFIFTFCIGIIFAKEINADTICEYAGDSTSGQLTVTFSVTDKAKLNGKAIVDGYFNTPDKSNQYFSSKKFNVKNWKNKKLEMNISGKDFFEKKGKCPPYAVVTDEQDGPNLFISSEDDLDTLINYGREKQAYQVLDLLNQNLIGKSYTINFVKNLEAADGSMDSIKTVYGERAYIPETGYKLSGYEVIGYRIYNNGKWKCKDKYKKECSSETDYEIVSPDSMTMIEFNSKDPNVYLYAQWEVKANISSQTINQYGLDEKYCTGSGFVWNESNGGYCNTDKLQYVTCGNSYDIPVEVPRLVSYLVNLLKIFAPIILIITAMITLFKALVASKDDEMKKAQSSLIKKIIASVMVFLVISIVQFVILKVADSSEKKSISNCMSCFLNNDCIDTTYYKTNIGGVYYCTLVTETGRGDFISCNDFYEDKIEEFKEN